MSDIDQTAELDLVGPRGRGPLVKWGLIGIAALLLLGVGGAVWYFLLGGREHFSSAHPKEVETPLPYFLQMKQFVVSMPGSTGTMHFVQLGVGLQLPDPAAGEMVTSLMPGVQDAMRETLLGFKVDDLQSVEGLNRVRRAMIRHVNEVMAQALGPERMVKLTAGHPGGELVMNILFPTLIVE